MKQPIYFEATKIKSLLLFLGIVGATIGCSLFALNPPKNIAIHQHALMYIGAALCGILSIPLFVNLFRRKSGLLIDQFGITDNSTIISAPTISWREISSIQLVERNSQKYIAIILRDLNQFYDSLSTCKKWFFKISAYFSPSPINIYSSLFDTDIYDLHITLLKAQKHYQPSNLR